MALNCSFPGQRVGLLVLTCAFGCSNADNTYVTPHDAPLVPARGTVTYNGKPLSGALVTLMPESGWSSVGETNEAGQFGVESSGRSGAPAGQYKVIISYLLSSEGVPQGLRLRSAMDPPPSMRNAKEFLAPEYSTLEKTSLKVEVPSTGTTSLNFDLKGPPIEPPKPAEGAAPAAEEPGSSSPASEPAPAKTEP